MRSEGNVYRVPGLVTLLRWTLEKRILATDEISRDGNDWQTVSSHKTLRPYFAALRTERELRRELRAMRERIRELERGARPGSHPRAVKRND